MRAPGTRLHIRPDAGWLAALALSHGAALLAIQQSMLPWPMALLLSSAVVGSGAWQALTHWRQYLRQTVELYVSAEGAEVTFDGICRGVLIEDQILTFGPLTLIPWQDQCAKEYTVVMTRATLPEQERRALVLALRYRAFISASEDGGTSTVSAA